ncbi:GAK system XXXCH domain-containing protein [Maridesulfovibrio sp.]|uniref:GAK system XXXCH domain-containing protein n=1 Tax=Maridesulfovibrio sp. TaxID=2795000 RepID=UPI0029C9E053|nr:GAK system XXXCH domain-containing protein [Maridesulfovibrio sp.]
MAKHNKIERMMSAEELPDFLRKMASAIENGATDENAYLASIEGFEKLKMGIRNENGQTVIKIKAKPSKEIPATHLSETEVDEPAETPGLKYTHLKKRMKKSFKIIFKALHTGNLPPKEAVQEFIDDSHLMVTYTDQGYGDEFYDEYIAGCDAFQKAFDEGDVEKAHAACDELNHIKTQCHAKYD